MQITNDKGLKNLVRSMRENLLAQHGIDVPYTALRACFLQAQGLNPHAQGTKPVQAQQAPDHEELLALVQEAPAFFHPEYDFGGDKLRWLQRAGLAACPQDLARVPSAAASLRGLFLVRDAKGELCRVALDEQGEFWLPTDFRFEIAALVRQEVTLAQAQTRANGLQPNLATPATFFPQQWALPLDPKRYHVSVSWRVPECEDAPVNLLLVRMPTYEWTRVLLAVLANKHILGLYERVLKWAQQKHQVNFALEAEENQANWLARYVGCYETPLDEPETAQVRFEWLWPDDTTQDAVAVVDLQTGVVTVHENVPADTLSEQVATRVELSEEHHCTYEVWPLVEGSTRYWEVHHEVLQEIRQFFRVRS